MVKTYYGGHIRHEKCRPPYNILVFNQISFKFDNARDLVIITNLWRENDVTKLEPKFRFDIMVYSMAVLERASHEKLKAET